MIKIIEILLKIDQSIKIKRVTIQICDEGNWEKIGDISVFQIDYNV